MLLNLMEGKPITSSNAVPTITNFKIPDREHNSVKALLKNFTRTETNTMAIKDNQIEQLSVYAVPVQSFTPPINNRMKSINDAKLAFLNSTVNSAPGTYNQQRQEHEPTIHYAQIAVGTESEDSRSTGGGKDVKYLSPSKAHRINYSPIDITSTGKKTIDQPRKVSFKTKNASSSYKRPPIATKTTMTLSKSNVSELTKKFNNLVVESHNGSIKQSKLAKTIEDLQTASRNSVSNSSTPSSTLSTSPNIKIVLRQKRGSKKRSHRKRCSSVDSIDKLVLTDSSSAKIRVIRSKSDGTKIPKSPKKRLKHQNSNGSENGVDVIDGNSPKALEIKSNPNKPTSAESNVVKNVIKKFECEIIAQSSFSNTLKKQTAITTSTTPIKEKPKVPEKKSSIVLTKNLVVKDGVPKIKTIKPMTADIQNKINKESTVSIKKRESLYDKTKYKTNFIHADKLPLKVVEIAQDDVKVMSDVTVKNQDQNTHNNDDTTYQDISSNITPNDSFLWRRKSSSQIYSDSDKSVSESPYGFINLTMDEVTITCSGDTTQIYNEAEESLNLSETKESRDDNESIINKFDTNSDFESNLVEAYNKEVLLGFTSKPKKETIIEDDYETFEPQDIENVVVIPVRTIDRASKINCPLPEIPKDQHSESPISKNPEENIYQCLLEMRSHPEGDESMHNYESCQEQLEERTRGDGDSDDGYEYCKSPIKPYCLTSSSGIQIAEDYRPSDDNNIKNYAISKSVSGTSTASYEKIGSERIYEKIPPRPPKSKDSSPTFSSRHSVASSDYTGYNDTENIYDTIKHADGVSLSHCYESIPNSPSMVKLRNNLKKQLASAVQKRLSFDTVSNISQSTMSSEQKTNSIYGQRSVMSYNGHDMTFQVPSSETSERSDRSDDWVDVSDEEKNDEQKIIIVHERSRGRKSPVSWSQKVRHQWHNSSKPRNEDNECDSSDSGHLYESLEPATHTLPYVDDDFDSFDSDTDTDEHDKSAQAPPLPASRLPSPPSGGQYTLTKIASAAQKKMRQIKRNLTKRYSVAMDGKPFTKSTQNNTYDTPKAKVKSPIYANYERLDIQHPYSNISFNDTRPVLNKTENPVNGFNEELKTAVIEKRLSNGDVPPALPDKNATEKPSTPTESKKDSGTLSRKAYFSFKSRFRRATSMAVDINSEVPSALKITNSTFYLTDSMDGDSGFGNCSDSGQAGSTETLASGVRRRDGNVQRPWADSTPCLALQRPRAPPPPPPVGALPAGSPGALSAGSPGAPVASTGPRGSPTVAPVSPAAPHTDLSAVNEGLHEDSAKQRSVSVPPCCANNYSELKRLLPTLSRKEKSPRTRSSWYAECGADSASVATPTSNTSWYAEAGTAPAGHVSSSSGASSGSHPASPLPTSLFTHEPLYQFYNAAKVESVCRETGDSDSETYESGPAPAGPRPSAMALVAPRGPARTLWCEVPEVLNSAVLSSLAPAQKRVQEAKFELLTSEASYLNSLNVLVSHFASHPAFRDPQVLPPEDWETLFSTILPVRKCSQLLMNELEKCWQENILLEGICDIVQQHAEQHFDVYVKYCENQAPMVATLQRLRTRPAFSNALTRLESHPACQSLSLHSFLMLPMQRVTRLPLLVDVVLRHLPPAAPAAPPAARALGTLHHLVTQCNEGARNTERIEEMFRLSRVVEWSPTVRLPPVLGPACSRRDRKPVRWLVRSGEVTQLIWKADEMKLTFGRKFQKVPLYLFLFNDLLVVAKKKNEESFLAIDHCPRSLLETCASDVGTAKHAILLTLLDNHEGRTLEMLLSMPSETEMSRWEEALSVGGGGGAEGEAVYAGWDCPQVAALYCYRPAQPDELALAEGDVVNVSRKTKEGWYYGERTRDGEQGWFPGAFTAEIASAHVRARNLRQRYRLLALSASYRTHRRRPH